jgi:uncharacterized lipoprotein YmbA
MNRLKKRILFFFLTLNLLSCTSYQHTTYYLLTAIEPTDSILEIKSNKPLMRILVKNIKFPDYLDRPQMVLRDNDYKLELNEYHRWAEPLKDDFTRVFIENLNTRIMPNLANNYAGLEGVKPSHKLSIEVLRMDVNTNNQVILKTKWNLSSAKNNGLVITHKGEFTIPVNNKSHESAVEAQSKAIALFADQIATTIQTLQQHSKKQSK